MKITLNILIVFVYTFLCSSNGSKDQDDIHHKLSYLEEQKADTNTFDLIIYGKDFAAGEIKVNLKSNPAFGERWEVAGKGVKPVYYNNKLIIIKGIARNRYVGQDIRENYISARLTNTGEKQIMISAVYALPSSDYNGANKLSALSETIEERPHEIEKYSLASHVRPHPFIIEGGKTWTEHIEAPVKTFKPGVREVKWLDILFTDTKIEAKVPADYVRNFFGAAHLKTEYHPYAASTGVTWSRVGTRWDRQELEKDEYDFSTYDELVESARSYGIKVLPLLAYTAPWASSVRPGHEDSHRYPPAENMIKEWQQYIEEVVKRYPDIEYFEVWNEPNIDWFLRADENYKVYVDKILVPAAEVIHNYGRKVVGLSFTTEWPLDSWPAKSRPRKHAENVSSNIKDIDRWLSYHDAWKYIDILAVHYPHGDVEKPSEPYAENMMPFFDHVYKRWIETGMIQGIWNTEAGFAGVEAGMQGFVALDPWEQPPLEQWVARYVIPPLHWSIEHNWHFRDQYKLFWYHMSVGDHPRDMLTRAGEKIIPSSRGQALHTISSMFTGGDTVSICRREINTGFGIFSDDTTAINYFAPYKFRNYAFTIDENIVVAVWANLPGKKAFGKNMQVTVEGMEGKPYRVYTIHYINGEKSEVGNFKFRDDGNMYIEIPPTDEPIIYIVIEPQ
ncbi:MAG: hypothetical protein ACQERS_03310 [Bacteroidota bacterium]